MNEKKLVHGPKYGRNICISKKPSIRPLYRYTTLTTASHQKLMMTFTLTLALIVISSNKGDALLILWSNECRFFFESVATQQNKTKCEAFHVSAAWIYHGFFTLWPKISVMPVAAEVMAPVSEWRTAPPLCPPAEVVISTQELDTGLEEELHMKKTR